MIKKTAFQFFISFDFKSRESSGVGNTEISDSRTSRYSVI